MVRKRSPAKAVPATSGLRASVIVSCPCTLCVNDTYTPAAPYLAQDVATAVFAMDEHTVSEYEGAPRTPEARFEYEGTPRTPEPRFPVNAYGLADESPVSTVVSEAYATRPPGTPTGPPPAVSTCRR